MPTLTEEELTACNIPDFREAIAEYRANPTATNKKGVFKAGSSVCTDIFTDNCEVVRWKQLLAREYGTTQDIDNADEEVQQRRRGGPDEV